MSQVHFDSSRVHSTPNAPLHTQLKFNLNAPLHTQYQQQQVNANKPRPILIEKLVPRSEQYEPPVQPSLIPQTFRSYIPPPDAVVSSNRLYTAVQLAQMDIKRLKNEMEGTVTVATDVPVCLSKEGQREETKNPIKSKDSVKSNNKTKPAKAKKISQSNVTNAQKTSANTKESNNKKERYAYELYPVTNTKTDATNVKKENEVEENDEELSRLKKDLMKHSKALEQVVNKLNLSVNDETRTPQGEHQRKLRRVEEQTTRSTRLLYTLQQKIGQINRDNTRHTKKTESAKNLASTHRAAIRALQMFVNQAELFYRTKGNLPPLYKDLGSLIQQLSLVTSAVSSGKASKESLEAIERLMETLNKMSKTSAETNKEETKRGYLNEKDVWIKEKAKQLRMKSLLEKTETTPDRASMLNHATETLMEAFKNKTPKEKNVKKARSLFLPQKLQKTRKNNIRLATNRKSVEFRLPKPTASSEARRRLNEQRKRPLETKENLTKRTPANKKSSPQKLRNDGLRQSLPQRLRNDELHHTSSALRNHSPPEREPHFATREAERQVWLDKQKQEELRKLNKLGNITQKEFDRIRKELCASNPVILSAENEIKTRLQPLLDKAEVIATEESKRQDELKSSLNLRLADITSQKAVSEGERLAEYILDDILIETALELQKMEMDSQAEMEAAFQCDRPTLENVEQRLKEFQHEQEAIQRCWQSAQYSSFQNKENGSVCFTNHQTKSTDRNTRDINDSCQKTSIDVPSSVRQSIRLHRQRYEYHLDKSNTHSLDVFLMTEYLTEELIDQLLSDVALELNHNCSSFVDDVYEKEFLHIA